MSSKINDSVSVTNEKKLLAFMDIEDKCSKCYKLAPLYSTNLSDGGEVVEGWYKCKCGYKFGYEYSGGFVEKFKSAQMTGELEKDLKRIQKDYPKFRPIVSVYSSSPKVIKNITKKKFIDKNI